MMDLTTPPVLIGDGHLKNWLVIGSGGFGQIHKARHAEWGLDVAIKLLHYDDGSSSLLLREADLMRQGGSPYVLRVLGVYQGRPPCSGPSSQLGLVMEFMERGTLEALLDTLSGPPPWPLAYRLAHQIALGMNFLHRLPTPLLHLDLKPSNVLLDDNLTAKLADFGLAKVSQSISMASGKTNAEEEGGTISYMPPEAFDSISYKPTKASDIYSYAILLWSLITGKRPYLNVFSSLVRFRIPMGDRPSLESVDRGQSPELGQLVELMERCWDTVPVKRPSFLECVTVTEGLFEKHKHGIKDIVHEVLTKLDVASAERTMNRCLHIQDTSWPSGSLQELPSHMKTTELHESNRTLTNEKEELNNQLKEMQQQLQKVREEEERRVDSVKIAFLNQLQAERSLKIQAVNKLAEIMNRTEARSGGDRSGATDVRRKEKENRKLQLELRSEKEKLNSTIIKYQREINDMQALITDESQVRMELQMALDSKDSDIEQLRNQISSLSVHSLDSVSISSAYDMDLDNDYPDTRLEGWLSLPDKISKRFRWDRKYVVVSSRKILFYHSEGDREQANPFLVLDIDKLVHVRSVTQTDVYRADAREIPRIFQILYANEGETKREQEFALPPLVPDVSLPYKGHEFIPTLYHFPSVCEACPRPLWHVFKPPPAVECRRCHVKCHKDHLDKKEEVIAPCRVNGVVTPAKDLLLLAATEEEQKRWVRRLNERIGVRDPEPSSTL